MLVKVLHSIHQLDGLLNKTHVSSKSNDSFLKHTYKAESNSRCTNMQSTYIL